MSDSIITVDRLGKKYRLLHNVSGIRYKSLREVIAAKARRLITMPRNRPSRTVEEFWALKNVSFSIARGEIVGVIGRNGAGKSTLLKTLSRITEPTRGRIHLRGRVGSLLEVGTGFHPELTGRENIYLNGAILGMSKVEITSKFDEIVAFSEVEQFLDTPVKRYSSGMYVRLAFAVAAHLDPEILIVDEVLAVGDVAFQKKCLDKMGSVAKGEGRTILFVSHNMQAIRQLCSRAILLNAGEVLQDGKTADVIQGYLQAGTSATSLDSLQELVDRLPRDPAVRLLRIDVRQDGRSSLELLTGLPLEISIEYEVFQPVVGLHVYFQLYDADGNLLFESLNNGDENDIPRTRQGRYISRATVPADFLASRRYELEFNVAIHRVRECIPQPSVLRVPVFVSGGGTVNRAYLGYNSPGKLAPLIPWVNDLIS